MASNNKELLITLGADTTSYTDKIRRAKDITKELESEFELLSGSSKNFESSVQGLAAKEDLLSKKLKVSKEALKAHNQYLRESEQEYKKAAQAQQTLASKLQTFKNALANVPQGSSSYEKLSKTIGKIEQEIKKADARTETYNKRILKTNTAINTTQNEMQGLQRELYETNEKMALADRDDLFDGMKADITETARKFDLLKLSTTDFGKTFVTLEQTQGHYNTMMAKTEALMKEQKTDIESSKRSVTTYQTKLAQLTKEYERYSALLATTKPTDTNFEYFSKKVQEFREKIASCNSMIELHSSRIDKLTTDYKEGEMNLARFGNEISVVKAKMQEMKDSITFTRIETQLEKLAKDTMQQLENEISQVRAKFELLEASCEGYENTVTGLKAKQTSLMDQIRLTRTLLEQYQVTVSETSQKLQLLTNQKKMLESAMSRTVAAKDTMNAAELDRATKNMTQLKEKYDQVNSEIEQYYAKNQKAKQSVQDLTLKTAQMSTELQRARTSMKNMQVQTAFDKVEKDITEVNLKLKELDAEMNLANAKFKNFGGTISTVGAKQDLLKRKIEATKNLLSNYNSKIQLHQTQLEKLQNRYNQVGAAIEKTKAKMSTAQAGSEQYTKLETALIKLEAKYKTLDKEITTNKTKMSELKATYTNTQASVVSLTASMNGLVASTLKNVGANIAGLGQKISSVGQAMLPLTMYIGMIGGYALKTGAEFQTAMSEVSALTNATDVEFQKLTDTARTLAKETVFTASESASALKFLALAGYDTNQACAALPEILQAAQAGAMDLATASDLATDSIASLGYVGADAVAALPDYLDEVAAASANANTSMEQLMQAYVKVGGQVDNLGISMETSSTMLGILANRGIKAEQAGNSLNSILINMVKKSGESSKALDKLGVSMFDAKGNTRDIEDVMKDLAKALSGCTEEQKNQYLAMIGGKTQYKTLSKLLQGMVDDSGNLTIEYKNLKKEIEDAPDDSALQKMSETMTDNLEGDFKILKSQLEEFFISFTDKATPTLREFLQTITNTIDAVTRKFNSLGQGTQSLIVKALALGAAFPLVTIALGGLLKVIGFSIGKVGSLVGTFIALKAPMMTLVTTSGGLTARFTAMFAQMGFATGEGTLFGKVLGLLNIKTLAIVAAIAALTIGLVKLYNEGCKKAIGGFDEITDGMSTANKTMVDTFIDTTNHIEALFMNLEHTTSAVTSSMVNEVTSNVNSLSENTLSILEEEQKRSKKILENGLNLVTNTSKKEKEAVAEHVKEAYQKKIDTVKNSQQKIAEILDKAREENRANTSSELKEIQEHYENIKQVSITAMSGYSSEMKTLQDNLNKYEKEINAEKIQDTLKTAREKRDASINEASQEYNELKSMYDLLKNDLSKNDREVLESAVKAAADKKQQTTEIANQEYAELVSAARRGAKESVDQIDWATGEIKSNFQTWGNSIDNAINTNGIKVWAENFNNTVELIRLKLQRLGSQIQLFFTVDPAQRSDLQKSISDMDTQIEGLESRIQRTKDLFGSLPQDIGSIMSQYDLTFQQINGMSTRAFFSQSEEDIKKLLDNYDDLPVGVQNSLKEMDSALINAGVSGGLQQLVDYSSGKIDTLRSEWGDLPKSLQDSLTNLENRFKDSNLEMSFEEFVKMCSTNADEAEKEFKKLPDGIKKVLSSLSKEDWERLFQYYDVAMETETEKANEKNKKKVEQKGKETKEAAKKQGKEQNKAQAEGIKSSSDKVTKATEDTNNKNKEKVSSDNGTNSASKKAGQEQNKSKAEGINSTSSEVTKATEKANEENKSAMEKGAKDSYNLGSKSTQNYADGMNSNLSSVSGAATNIQNSLNNIDNVKLGNVTKQLSEVNRWLKIVDNRSTSTKNSLNAIQNISLGGATKGLSEVNKWLKNVDSSAKNVKSSFTNITYGVHWGNTTKGLSEVVKWLKNVNTNSKTDKKSLESMAATKMGGLTKRLSEVTKWLNNVKNGANSARIALMNMAAVQMGGLTRRLSEVRNWLQRVKKEANTSSHAINNMNVSSPKVSKNANVREDQKPVAFSATSRLAAPRLAAPRLAEAKDIVTYATTGTSVYDYQVSGGYYAPQKMDSKNQQQDVTDQPIYKLLVEQNKLLMSLLAKDQIIQTQVVMDGREIAKASGKYMKSEINSIEKRQNRLAGMSY